MPNWVGDLVMATPILSELRRHFPDAEITAMCFERVAPLLEHDRDIDNLFTFSRPTIWMKRDQRRNLIATLRAREYDLALLLTNSFSSAFWFWVSRIPQRIGFRADRRSLLLTRSIDPPKEIETQHQVETNKSLLPLLGIASSSSSPRLHLTPEERTLSRERLTQLGIPPDAPVIAINPGAAYGSAKCWLPERFQEVTKALLEDPRLCVLYFGDASQLSLVRQITAPFSSRVFSLAGSTTLRELTALISEVDLLLTNDSGPMHIAAALGTPLLSLFGSTSPIKTGPYGQPALSVLQKKVACAPCYLRECPTDFRCMKRISASEVHERLLSLLNK